MKVAVILYHELTHHVLCGVESYYCFEESSNRDESRLIRYLETCSEMEASRRAMHLSRLYQMEIRYVSFYRQRTHYCCLTSNSHLGIIKGNVNRGEDLVSAIQREVQEEVGILLPADRLQHTIPLSRQPKPTSVFLVPVTHAESIAILEHAEALRQRHYGEIFNVGFRDLQDTDHTCNYITNQVRKWMKSQDGNLPKVVKGSPLSYTTLLPLIQDTPIPYVYSYIEEPPFRWGAQRPSLIPPVPLGIDMEVQ